MFPIKIIKTEAMTGIHSLRLKFSFYEKATKMLPLDLMFTK